jgi:hypothetical protein
VTIDFEVTPDDIIAYNLYCLHHVSSVRQVQMRSRALWGTIAILALIITLAVRTNLLLVGIFGTILWISSVLVINHIFFLDYSIKKLVQKQIRKGRYTKAMGQQSLSISPEAYTHISPFAEVKRTWQTTEKIQVTDSHAFIFVDKSCAEIVPRRAFAENEMWQEFVRTLQTYHAEAVRSTT